MAARHALLAAATALLWAGTASAKVYIQLRPRASLIAGWNDNVQLDGSGADGFGQAAPGLKLDVFGEHSLHIDVDCQAGIGRLAHPERFGQSSGAFASNETCVAGMRDRLSPRTTIRMEARATYAQDPFAIAGLGLLLRKDQTQVFVGRLFGELQRALSTTSHVDFGLESRALHFGPNDPGNGYVVMPHVRYVKRTTPRVSWDFTVREQLFLSAGTTVQPGYPEGIPAGLLNEGHAALVGFTYRLSPRTEVSLRGGPLLLTGRGGEVLLPSVRAELTRTVPSSALYLAVAHDAIIGAGAAGPVVLDSVDAGLVAEFQRFAGRMRAGIYRNSNVHQSVTDPGLVGYSGEVALDLKITREWRFGVAALRDARLTQSAAAMFDRDVVQARLIWEKARF